MKRTQTLLQRVTDKRSRKVVFLSHCILNENTRYLGGACRGSCVREIVDECLNNEFGIVQMPCPEQIAWGGVTKRLLLMVYGAKETPLYRFRHLLLPIALAYTRMRYRRLAATVAGQIEDYLSSGFAVIAIVGVDGSPSCGVNKALDLEMALDLTAQIDVESVTVEQLNAIVRQCITPNRGLFVSALQQEFERRRMNVPCLAHDLLDEIDGRIAGAQWPMAEAAT